MWPNTPFLYVYTCIRKDPEEGEWVPYESKETLKGEEVLVKFCSSDRKGKIYYIEFLQVMKSGTISTTQSGENHG